MKLVIEIDLDAVAEELPRGDQVVGAHILATNLCKSILRLELAAKEHNINSPELAGTIAELEHSDQGNIARLSIVEGTFNRADLMDPTRPIFRSPLDD